MLFRNLSIILGLLLAVGMASATLSSFSSLGGTANISAPVLYAESGNELSLKHDSGTTYKLNGDPEDGFYTENFSSTDWYSFDVNMTVEAALDTQGNGSVELEFGYIDNGNHNKICTKNVYITSTSQQKKSAFCDAGFNGEAERFYYNATGLEDRTYWLNAYGDTKVEVVPE